MLQRVISLLAYIEPYIQIEQAASIDVGMDQAFVHCDLSKTRRSHRKSGCGYTYAANGVDHELCVVVLKRGSQWGVPLTVDG